MGTKTTGGLNREGPRPGVQWIDESRKFTAQCQDCVHGHNGHCRYGGREYAATANIVNRWAKDHAARTGHVVKVYQVKERTYGPRP